MAIEETIEEKLQELGLVLPDAVKAQICKRLPFASVSVRGSRLYPGMGSSTRMVHWQGPLVKSGQR